MILEKWVDLSKWQGNVSDTSLRAMKADGVQGICVGAWHGLDANPYVHSVLKRSRSIDLSTAIYAVINNRPGAWSVQQAKVAVGDEWPHLLFVSPDVEIRGVTEAILKDAFAEVERLDKRFILYTGNWFWDIWRSELGHYPIIGAPPVWLAVYNGIPNLSIPTRPGYGPIIGHQYTGSTSAYGTTVDFNVFDADWLRATPVPAPVPSPKEVLMGKIADQFAQLGREVEAQIEQAKTLPTPIPGPQGPAGPAGPAGTSAPAPTQRTYTVVSGDTLSGIAAKFGIADWRTIYNLNKATIGADPNLIQPGMVLVIP